MGEFGVSNWEDFNVEVLIARWGEKNSDFVKNAKDQGKFYTFMLLLCIVFA
jgi:hypothetical protein